jgi:hypothetical protein
MSKKWACRTYYNPNPFISVSWHDTIMMVPVPPFVVPTKAIHLDFSVVQGLWIGSFLSNGRGKKVIGDDLLFMGRGSDAGLFIPHISFPPTWMNIMTTLFGSSMILFGTSSVTLACKNAIWGNEDSDLAATPFGPVPFSLNLACHDPYSAPTDLVVVWGSVYTGMSLADLLAALIDFAINLACEVGMKYVAEPLAKKAGSGLKKMGGKASSAFKKAFPKTVAAAAKRRAAKGASKGFFSNIGTSISKLVGYQSTDAMKSYTSKAATTRGMYNTLKELCYSTGKNLDSDLIDLVNAGTPGVFSKEFLSELQNINSSKYDDYVEKMLKSSKSSLDGAEQAGADKIQKAVKDEFIDSIDYDDVITYKTIMTDDIAIDSVMRTTFFTAMKEMSDAAEKAASTELARSLGYVALKKSFTKILWKNTLRNGGLIQIDANILGYQLQYDSSPTLQFSEKWWANQEWFGEEIYSASDLGLTTTEDSEYWGDAYVEGDGTDEDDYWYADSTAISESVASEDTQDDDEDDYWYGDEDANAAE